MWGTRTRTLARTLAAIAVTLAFMPGVAQAATSTASASVVALKPLSLVKTQDLDFGSMIASPTAGTVIIDPFSDARTTTGGVTLAGGSPSAARFSAAGLLNVLAFITLPATIALTGSGGGTMTISAVTTNGPTTRLFPGTAILDVRVGGTVNVKANQTAGDYTGTFQVTVVYL